MLKQPLTEVFYKRVRGLCKKLDIEAEKVGLSFNNDKAQLLLPSGWSRPDAGVLPELDIRTDVCEDFEKQGMEIVGCPVGSEDFCKWYVRKTLKAILEHNTDLVNIHPQAAAKLLLNCLSPAPAFLSQVCHPNFTKDALQAFDKDLWELWTTILGGLGSKTGQLAMCKAGEVRAQKWSRLPTRMGGAGLRSWSTIAEYAWYCSFANCGAVEDKDLNSGRVFLKTECEQAHARALTILGGETYLNHASFEVMPPDEKDVLYDSNYYKEWKKDHKGSKLHKEFSNIVAERHLRHIASTTQLANAHVTNSEKIRTLQNRKQPGESVLTQLFKANLSDREARLTPSEYILSVRQFIGLPALKVPNGEVVELKCGCEAQKCPNSGCGGTIIDPHGNHALLCHKGITTRKATLLERALERTFRKSSGKSERQPTTYRLLGEVVPKEDLAALFSGGLTVEETKKNEDLGLELIDAFLMHPSALKESVLDEIRSRMPVVSESKIEASNNTIHFDLCMAAPFPHDCPRELWLDHAIVQETSESYQEGVLSHLEEGKEISKSPPFRRMEQSKQRRYAALIPIVKHLLKLRILDFQPFFLFPVISSLGYLNEDAFKMVKWMNTVLNQTLSSVTRDDGIPFSTVKARYKQEVKNALCFGLLRGNAFSMNAVGRPLVGRPI